jgi:RNA methyltransferase, TrmH family
MLSKAEISRLRSLQEKKHREALGLFVVEGEKVVSELLAEKFPLKEIYATPEWVGTMGTRIESVPVFLITPAEMERISHFPTPACVLAVGRLDRAELAVDELAQGLTLALDGVQDAGNVGTLLRVADWFGFNRVLLSPDCADVFSQKVINASMGSFSRMRVVTTPLPEALATTVVPVLGCDLEGEDVHALPARRDLVVVIGSEGRGLSKAVRKRVTSYVTIPRYGRAESLNAAVAAAIVCDHVRQKASGS